MPSRRATLYFMLAAAVVYAFPLYRGLTGSRSREFALPEPADYSEEDRRPPFYRECFVEDSLVPSQHCASFVELSDGDLLAVWYGGTNEGEPDVSLYQARWDRESGRWSNPSLVADIESTQEETGAYTKKIGNAVLFKDTGGRIWLFYVSVSVGGWSGSALNCKISRDGGRTWSRARRLVTDPFFNKGTLVKNSPVNFRDGSMGLPVYHEMIDKYGEFVHIGVDGTVLDKSPISRGLPSLQPAVVPLSKRRAIALLRDCSGKNGRIIRADTFDGGRTWINCRKISLPNPGAPVSCVRARDGVLWLVFNDAEENRDTLSFARSTDDGETWRKVYMFEDARGLGMEGFSYPFLAELDEGVFHLLYTWDRARIKHVTFNHAWMEKL